MSPFAESQSQSKPSLLGQFTAQPALIVCLVCLLAGLGAVFWKARADATRARSRARTEAQARSAALELEINQAISAAEVLGALARQNGGAIPNFQRVAAELLATRTNLASLELQPGGIVNDIAPRPAQERALGRNLLNDPVYRPVLLAAQQRRGPSVIGPVTLYRGEKGLIVQVPVVQRTRDNREYLWGFVAASLPLTDALARAQFDLLADHGYAYRLFVRSQPALSLAAHGTVSAGAEQQLLRAQNLEWVLQVQPQGGWFNPTKIGLEALAVLVVSGLLCLLINLLESRNDMEAALTEANQRLARESADRKQAQEEARALKDGAAAAQTDLKQSRFALQQAEAKLAEARTGQEAALRESQESSQAAQKRLQEAELKNTELQTRLDTAIQEGQRTAQAGQAELTQVHTALQQAQAANQELQARLQAAEQAQTESTVTVQIRREQDQATIAELQARLEATTRSASEAAQASAAALKQCEEHKRDLEARLLAAEQAAQLALQPEEPQADALPLSAVPTEPEAPIAMASVTTASVEEAQVEKAQVALAPVESSTSSEPAAVEPEPTAPTEATSETLSVTVTEEQLAPVSAEPSAPHADGEPAAPLSAASSEVFLPTPPIPAPASAEGLAPAAPEPPAKEKPAKAAKRKKSRRVDQMDFFGSKAPAESTPVTPVVAAPATEPALEPLGLPLFQLPASALPESSASPASAQPVPASAESEKVGAPPQEQLPAELEAQRPVETASQPADPAPATSSAVAPATAPMVEPLGLPLFTLPAPAQPESSALPVSAQPLAPAEPERVAEPAQEQTPVELATLLPLENTQQIPVELEALIPVEATSQPAELSMAEPVEAKPAAPAASLPELAAIEGLDTTDGLARAEGNPKFYLKALRHFTEHQANVPAKVRDALVQGDSAAAEQLIGTLQTAATEIGAITVVRAAETLARAVREQTDPGSIEFLWAELEKGLGDLVSDLKFLAKHKEEKPAAARPLPPSPPVNPAQLRKAVHQILPLLTDGDPGAKDCLKDNRATFRSAFTPEGYVEFEQLVKSAEFSVALEHLKKAVRKHGISV